jgi:hypothetical protein
LDIETAPNLATVWGLFNQNINIQNLINTSYTLCWAAAWYGEDEIIFDSIYQSSQRSMIKAIHKLLDEADVVVHYNGSRFDIPVLNREFLLYGLKPPSPYQQVDLLRVARNQFRFTSNKLDFVAQQLGLEGKTKHRGHELWLKCMNRDPEAWAEMEEYNVNDIAVLEAVYEAFKPWIKNHPNRSLFDGEIKCPVCGSHKLQRRGTARTSGGVYQRYQCGGCGHWSRGLKSEAASPKERVVSVR